MPRVFRGTEAVHVRPTDGAVFVIASNGLVACGDTTVARMGRNVRVNRAVFGTHVLGMILASLDSSSPRNEEELVTYDLLDGSVTTLVTDARFVDELFVSTDDTVAWAHNQPGTSSFVQMRTSPFFGRACFAPLFTTDRIVNLRVDAHLLFVLQSSGVLDIFRVDRDDGHVVWWMQSLFPPVMVPWHCATLFHHGVVLTVRTKTTLDVLLDTVRYTLEVPHTRDTDTVWVRFLFGTNAIATNVDESIRVYDVRTLAILYHMKNIVHPNLMFGGVASVRNKLVVGSTGKETLRNHFCAWSPKVHWLFARSGFVDNAVVRYVIFALSQLRCPADVTHCILERWITNRE